ncbi:MAG: sll0787 family AIR synthase-like protein [Luteolibacter sp.]
MLRSLADSLAAHPAVREKAEISSAFAPATGLSQGIPLGDDCAAIPNPTGTGHLLFAAEGMLESFVESDPWFAGYSAVMVNLSDIAAMGGTPIAITDVLWTPSEKISAEIWAGMQAASLAYGVPIVGGHTTKTTSGKAALAAAVIGHAGENLITSFHAKPGDHLVIAIDMNGAYRNDKPFWNASTTTPPERLRSDLALLPLLAEKQLVRSGKDISNGGIIGTLAMLCNCSEVGATLNLDQTPKPKGTTWEKWLTSFPSYGYLLAVSEKNLTEVKQTFQEGQITCQEIGQFTAAHSIDLKKGSSIETCLFNSQSPK